jgi:acyl-CoA thioester hydrolase
VTAPSPEATSAVAGQPRRAGSSAGTRNVHNHSVEIEVADIDFMGHVNNASYLRWVQTAVLQHWEGVAPNDAVEAYRWIAIRHEITYRRPAYLGDDITLTVRLDHVKRESAFYETTVRRGKEVLAEVSSRWCCVDARTLQPARVPRQVVECFFPEDSGCCQAWPVDTRNTAS